MAARVIKSNSINDGQFPLPADPHKASHEQTAATNDTAFEGVEPAELQHSLGELQQMVGMIAGMRPAVQALSEYLGQMSSQHGYQEGYASAQSEVERHLIDVLAALTDAQRERHRLALENEGAIADLALNIAKSIIGSSFKADPALVRQVVLDAVRDLEPSTALEIRVHPNDLSSIEQGRAELERMLQGAGDLTITADDTVDPGGVVLISPVGEVDARISTKLGVLETAFASQRRKLSAEG